VSSKSRSFVVRSCVQAIVTRSVIVQGIYLNYILDISLCMYKNKSHVDMYFIPNHLFSNNH